MNNKPQYWIELNHVQLFYENWYFTKFTPFDYWLLFDWFKSSNESKIKTLTTLFEPRLGQKKGQFD